MAISGITAFEFISVVYSEFVNAASFGEGTEESFVQLLDTCQTYSGVGDEESYIADMFMLGGYQARAGNVGRAREYAAVALKAFVDMSLPLQLCLPV